MMGVLHAVVMVVVLVMAWWLGAGEDNKCDMEGISLEGKVVIVTGANTGIGYQIALEVATRGGRLVMACRNARKAQAARESIVAASGSKLVSVIGIDLAKMKHVSKFVENFKEKFDHVDVIINNAAMGDATNERAETTEGLEQMMATNHLGPFHLTTSLLPLLSKDGVVITMTGKPNNTLAVDMDNMNSEADYSPTTLYDRSKLLSMLMMRELASTMVSTMPGLAFYSVDPGFTWTDLHTGWGFWLAGPVIGAARASTAASTLVWLAGGGGRTENEGKGELWKNCRVCETEERNGGQIEQREMREKSEKLIKKALGS
eukprot:TRINITY_DN35374_c0_g1_i1.p1 TRINITY_DN35374_c0_g1~~TRINITY_DN35374_c0_g1_i1.p1  ORF type:complete len:317 (-),score=88.16 TRINITY_DN35374_c0_g1_i1:30-980(-)